MIQDDPLWFKDAIIYELHVKAFFDGDNDGMGDFAGLTQKLDYVQDLGVNTIWLLPFYPSPLRDDGYDIADYRGVHPQYGTLTDARNFIREAHRRGLRVITELVINHTSDQHPWFQAARKAPPGSLKRNYYVWSDTDEKYPNTRVIFTDTERSNWTWDEEAKAYYWHRFFSHQPDLNFDNPHVVKAILRVMRAWFDMGVDGMRLDAIPYLIERDGTNNENLPETHALIKLLRAHLDKHYTNRIFLAEANQWPEDVREYFGNGDECHMAYHFPLMPRMYMAIAQEDRHPIVEIMQQTPDIPPNCQWAIFLRNHDELTLEMVTDRERDYMYSMYATDPRMRVNVGIRRRLAPLMENTRAKIELLNILLMTMPGSPMIYYGDELGMGDNIFLGDRDGVRTPMQWSPDRNAGFSRTNPARMYLPPIMDPEYGYESVNVEAQTRNPSSLLNWMKRLIAIRKNYRAFGRGTLAFLRPGNRKILAYLREYEDETLLCVVNLSRNPQPVELDLSKFKGRVPIELVGITPFPPIGDLPYLLTLPAYGFFGFRLDASAEVPSWHTEIIARDELPVLVFTEGWGGLLGGKAAVDDVRKLSVQRVHTQIENEILPHHFSQQRWYGGKHQVASRMTLHTLGDFVDEQHRSAVNFVEIHHGAGESAFYFLPMTIAWEQGNVDEDLRRLGAWTVAKVRQKSRMGLLIDALRDDVFCRAIVRAMRDNKQMPLQQGTLRFTSSPALREWSTSIDGDIQRPQHDQSNTSITLGADLYLKAYRRVQKGSSPELEIGRYLMDAAHYAHSVPVLGALEFAHQDGSIYTLALLQRYMPNQGNAWTYALDYLGRYLDSAMPEAGEQPAADHAFVHAPFNVLMQRLGTRTAELHQALGRATVDPNFGQEPVLRTDIERWTTQVRDESLQTLAQLEQHMAQLPADIRPLAAQLLEHRGMVLAICNAERFAKINTVKIRYHGDYHLGQVLMVQNDFLIIDFEGEPTRTLEQRRAKHTATRDVAGMLRSISYVAGSAVKHIAAQRPQHRAAIEPAAREWQRQAEQAFLQGYREQLGRSAIQPHNAEHARALLDLFLVEKVMYELRYELTNRPQWIDIPIRGALELLQVERSASV